MKRLTLIFAALTLTGCATVLTPQRCEQALAAAQTAQEIIAMLQARGVAPETAAKIAAALSLGQITLATACAASNTGT